MNEPTYRTADRTEQPGFRSGDDVSLTSYGAVLRGVVLTADSRCVRVLTAHGSILPCMPNEVTHRS